MRRVHTAHRLTRHTLKVGPAVTSIGDHAFANTDLTELDLARLSDATALQTIVNNAFSGTPLEGQHRVGCITPTRCFDLNYVRMGRARHRVPSDLAHHTGCAEPRLRVTPALISSVGAQHD